MVSKNSHFFKLRVKAEAELTDFRIYDLRHSFGSKLGISGIGIYTISKLMGHANIEMSKKYVHLSDEHYRNAVSVL